MDFYTLKYDDGKLTILDQTKLPGEEIYTELTTVDDVYDAIRKLKVRGAPAIGVCAAYGIVVAHKTGWDIDRACDRLISSRPTAVNLAWAVERMRNVYRTACEKGMNDEGEILDILTEEADRIYQEDVDACMGMAENGLSLLKPGMGILTHCNAGALATAGLGTCLAPIHLGQQRGYGFRVYADETRPLLQGARLTAWELAKDGIDVTVICDNMASTVMKQGKIDAVVVGCDRMAANGDCANKIGSSGVAILAKEYGIPVYFFVPTSTIDYDTPSGDKIPIEQRDPDEIGSMWYREKMVPEGAKLYNPAFDVTDHEYITAIVTEEGILYPPYDIKA